jgi:hypothetical protein
LKGADEDMTDEELRKSDSIDYCMAALQFIRANFS